MPVSSPPAATMAAGPTAVAHWYAAAGLDPTTGLPAPVDATRAARNSYSAANAPILSTASIRAQLLHLECQGRAMASASDFAAVRATIVAALNTAAAAIGATAPKS